RPGRVAPRDDEAARRLELVPPALARMAAADQARSRCAAARGELRRVLTMRLFQPFRRAETYRALLFYVAQLALGLIGFTLLVAGWPITLGFAITPLVVPLLVGLRLAVGGLARAEASIARDLIGARTRTPVSSPASGFWYRGLAVLRDPAFWKQQVHLVLAWPIALVPLAVLSFALQLISLPVWYRWADSTDVFGRAVDTFAESLVFCAMG